MAHITQHDDNGHIHAILLIKRTQPYKSIPKIRPHYTNLSNSIM